MAFNDLLTTSHAEVLNLMREAREHLTIYHGKDFQR
jgi:hypothetical protein